MLRPRSILKNFHLKTEVRGQVPRAVSSYPHSLNASSSRKNGLNQTSSYHSSRKIENDLILGGAAIAASALGLQYAINIYKAMPKKSSVETDASTPAGTSTTAKSRGEKKKKTAAADSGSNDAAGASSSWTTWFARTFYDGGFEEKMTKREAALILGVRESATPERVKDAHRRILLLNHPDRGGSAYMAAKINEAKDLLLKGKS